MATSKCRSRDANETFNEVSTDSSHRTQRLENRATAIPAELYQATPHCTTKVPPATALFGQNIRTKLPEQPSKVNIKKIDKKINEADASAKAKQKAYADHRRGATSPIFKVGDQVLVRQRKRSN